MEDSANMLKADQQANGERLTRGGSAPRSPRGTKNSKMAEKRCDRDFIFGKLIGEGSFSSVYLAKDIHTNYEYAVKVCDKEHIRREKKVKQIVREKDAMNILNSNWEVTAPFFVKLSYAFQDANKLYFVMTHCRNGELLGLIQRVGSLDSVSTAFYTAQIVRALEHLHYLQIIHRDLKPENILLDEEMHIKITDFGCAKILNNEEEEEGGGGSERCRKNSFVGTAQYVSPELLCSKPCGPMVDVWALGCIIYQMLSGSPPFSSKSEYFIYQKIQRLDYEFPNGFCEKAKDLVKKVLVIDSCARLGAHDSPGRYTSLRTHPFLSDLDLDGLHLTTPPTVAPPPAPPEDEEIQWEQNQPGLKSIELQLELGLQLKDSLEEEEEPPARKKDRSRNLADVDEDEKMRRLAEQERENKWNKFVEGNLILKQGFMDKRKGLFPRRRMFLLTTGPHLYYVDPVNQVLKGQVPWSKTMSTEAKNFKTFFVHTPNRTYYLEEPEGYALRWCKAIDEVKNYYFPPSSSSSSSSAS